MKIELLSKYKEYEEFTKNESCTFYQSKKYLKFLEQTLHENAQLIIAENNGKLTGVLPFFCKKSKYGKVINSLPFFGSYGGIISSNIDIKKKILKFLNEYNKENDVLSTVIVTNPFEKTETYDKYFKYVDKIDRLAQCVNLINYSENNVWQSFEQRVRRSIRKSQKNHVTVENVEPSESILDEFYNQHITNISAKSGTVKPKEFFSRVKENFKIHEDYDIFTARYESKAIAFLLVFYFKSFTEYYMPAYDVKNSSLQGTSLLIWESIKKSLQNKCKYYNFGGTHMKNDSLYIFKKGWGSNDLHYNYYIYSNVDSLESIGKTSLMTNFKNFYVYDYDKISNKDK